MAMPKITPYELLGVAKTDISSAISLAYRRCILELKKDRLKPVGERTITTDKFRLICRAYELLCNQDERKHYDQTKEWRWYVPVENYTLQQLVAEPDLAPLLTTRLQNATLRQINAQDSVTGHTPLYCAARACNVEAVSYLTEQGAEPDLKQRFGSTALHVAAFYGHPEVVRCLLESGADYCQYNANNHLAEDESYDDDVKRCFTELKQNPYVQAAANQLDWFKNNIGHISQHVDYQYYSLRQTLLHCASKKGHKDLVRWLVKERAANLDIVDINLNSALHLAAYAGHHSIVKYLLAHGADTLLINKWGMTAEQESLMHGKSMTKHFQSMRDHDMFKMAADGTDWWFRYHFGAKSPDAMNDAGVSLLYVACRNGRKSVAKWLIKKGADINLQIQDESKSTPLHAAAYHNHVSTVALLLNHGANTNIRNKYGSTALDDARSDAVKKLLRQHRQNLTENKWISVHLFGDGAKTGNEPLARVQLHCDANFHDLLQSMPEALRNIYRNFSMARRPLNSGSDDIQVVSAVCRARCGKTKFIDLPLCITAHESPRYTHSGHTMSPELPFYSLREFHSRFSSKCQTAKLTIKAHKHTPQKFTLNTLLFTFPAECVQTNLIINVSYIFSPNIQSFDLPGCVYLFKTQCNQEENQLDEMPIVSLINEPNARLYTWAQSSAYWFTSDEKKTLLPSIGSIHAFVKHIDVIPSLLSLPGDMFIQGALGKPLVSRQDPVVCYCLKVCEHNKSVFSNIAYHGTTIGVICSILMDGLVMPSTVVSSGIRVCPPTHHIPRGASAYGIDDFANGIFISPSVHYCSDPCYAVTFSHNDERLIAVLECSVKSGSYESFPCTVQDYKPHPSDNMQAIEWRLTNPAAIEIISVLFIPINKSRSKAAISRAKKLGVDPNDMA
ncbi:unnamed protein product [Rotaria sp. Silwood2]|nr:unnamed protein product [Rotaria sp. Silwood2]CAF4475270.1 unnamed protein product [Rotaria sp. Silwood2]